MKLRDHTIIATMLFIAFVSSSYLESKFVYINQTHRIAFEEKKGETLEKFINSTTTEKLSCLEIIWDNEVGIVSDICEKNNMTEEQRYYIEAWLKDNDYTWGDVLEDGKGQYIVDVDETGGIITKIYLKDILDDM